MKGKVIVVWFSCGAASAVAAKITLEKYGKNNTVRIVNNPILEEHSDNSRFLRDCEEWFGVSIETSTNPSFPDNSAVSVWEKKRYMSGVKGAPCTFELKKKARQLWEKNNHHDFMVMGFTKDEETRHKNFVSRERENILPVLIEEGLTKEDCFKVIQSAGIKLPEIYNLGFPNANCIGCVKATSPTYWNLVRREFPEVFQQRLEMSSRLGVKLTRQDGKREYLENLRPDTKGRSLKSIKMPDCGIFCEEKDKQERES